MKTFFKIILAGAIFIGGFMLIEILPPEIYDEKFKEGLRVGWFLVNVGAVFLTAIVEWGEEE